MKEFAGDDPFEMVAVARPEAVTEESDRQTARCLVEEFALGGFTAHEIGELFTSPAFGLPHAIYRRRGADFVRELVLGVFGARP
jgi:hypothetical protein